MWGPAGRPAAPPRSFPGSRDAPRPSRPLRFFDANVGHQHPDVPEVFHDSGSGLNWSHDALQRARLWRRLRAESKQDLALLSQHATLLLHAERAAQRVHLTSADRLTDSADRVARQLADAAEPANVLIEESRDVYAELPALKVQAVAAWLYGTPATLDAKRLRELLPRAEHERCRQVLARIAGLGHQREAIPLTDRTIDPVLLSVLDEGLERHEGQCLRDTELTLYLHLFARGYQPNGRRVCERCQLVVHQARRAGACQRCRKSPPRHQPKPWHRSITIGTRIPARAPVLIRHGNSLTVSLTRDRNPTETIYTGVCTCGNLFESTQANTRYCENCATPRARTARTRTKPPRSAS